MPKAVKTKKTVHPNSRVAAQLARQTHRDEKLNKRMKEKKLKVEALCEKLRWFFDHLDASKTVYTKSEACKLIESYLHRYDDELDQHETEKKSKANLLRVVNDRSTRIELIRLTIEKESNEFKSNGLEIPDLLNGRNLKIFREWNREARSVQAIKLRPVKEAVQDSNAANQLNTGTEENLEEIGGEESNFDAEESAGED